MSNRKIQRRLAAIVFTDIVGFSRIMGSSEARALQLLDRQQALINPLVEEFGGSILKAMGDGLLIEFASSVNAVECAIAIQSEIEKSRSGEDDDFHIRIGIHIGDVVTLENDILGDGVNIASRIEPLASPGGICITRVVYDSVKSSLNLSARRIDAVELKNIDEKHTLYKIPAETSLDSSQQSGEDVSRQNVQLDQVQDETRLIQSLARLWPLQLVLVLIWLSLSFRHFDLWSGVLFLLVASAIVTGAVHRRTYRLTFADIRHVDVLLEVLIVNMNYGLTEQKGKKRKYVHAPAEWKNRRWASWIREGDTLTVDFDGNVVKIEGPFYHARKVVAGVKKLSRAGRR